MGLKGTYWIYCIITGLIFCCNSTILAQPGLINTKIDGYRGIWFELGQKYPYGDKYSGGLGTYTAKHRPLAIYAEAVDKTFFVYGGTTRRDERHLLAMIGEYDHQTQMLSKPTVVYDKLTVDDPHDNPSLTIDDEGFIYVFVSGRGRSRLGIKLKSSQPYNIDRFDILGEEEFTYPQIWNTDQGFFHFFTKYTGVRELYFETSKDGLNWTADQKLAGIREMPGEKAGHYQISDHFKNGAIIGTFFSRHRDGHPDYRTDLYYIQTQDFGKSWQTIDGSGVQIPLEQVKNPCLVFDYYSEQKNVYLKDMNYDEEGNPICLFLTSNGHEPGPDNRPYQWQIACWNADDWQIHNVAESDHNYDMGSLYISDSIWTIVAPTIDGPQKYAGGGEIVIRVSNDQGKNWKIQNQITRNSTRNHGYIRRPVNAKTPFQFFWADGKGHTFSPSFLYFGDFEGNVWQMPYEMKAQHDKANLFIIKK